MWTGPSFDETMPALRRDMFRLAPLGVLSDVALFLPLGCVRAESTWAGSCTSALTDVVAFGEPHLDGVVILVRCRKDAPRQSLFSEPREKC